MDATVIGNGIYAGIPYIVVLKGGKIYIGLSELMVTFVAKGANPKLLDDIGDQDPDDVMAAFLESTPKENIPTSPEPK